MEREKRQIQSAYARHQKRERRAGHAADWRADQLKKRATRCRASATERLLVVPPAHQEEPPRVDDAEQSMSAATSAGAVPDAATPPLGVGSFHCARGVRWFGILWACVALVAVLLTFCSFGYVLVSWGGAALARMQPRSLAHLPQLGTIRAAGAFLAEPLVATSTVSNFGRRFA